MKIDSATGLVKFDTRDEVFETARKYGWALYVARHHRSITELVHDMESRGMERAVFPQYFDFVMLRDGRVQEIVEYEPETGALLTNTIFMETDAAPDPSVTGLCKKHIIKTP
jgi:hypothetical protein